jgi:hypothetical protein
MKIVKVAIIVVVLLVVVAILGDDETRSSLMARVKGGRTTPEDNPVDT